MKYTIENNLLFVECYNDNQEFETIMIFEKEDSKEYIKSELEKKRRYKYVFCESFRSHWILDSS